MDSFDEPKQQHVNISEHVTYNELINSSYATEHGIDNTPSMEVIENAKKVAINCFEPIRKWVGNRIYISSFFRNLVVNKGVGGTIHSNHLFANAIDMDFNVFGGKTNQEVFDWIKENLDFDELLWEGGYNGWIHIGYVNKEKNRHFVGIIPNPK